MAADVEAIGDWTGLNDRLWHWWRVEWEVIDSDVLVLRLGTSLLGCWANGGLSSVGVDVDDGLDVAVVIGLEIVRHIGGGLLVGILTIGNALISRLKEFGKVRFGEGEREGMAY